jgi:hypothetical protein
MPKRYITHKRKRQRGGAGLVKSVKNFFKRKNKIRYTPIQPKDIDTPEKWLKEFMVAVKLRDNPPEQFKEEEKQLVLQSIELCKEKYFENQQHDYSFSGDVEKFLNKMSYDDFFYILRFLDKVYGYNIFGVHGRKMLIIKRLPEKTRRENVKKYNLMLGPTKKNKNVRIDDASFASGDEDLDLIYGENSKLLNKPTLGIMKEDVNIDEIDLSADSSESEEKVKMQKSEALRQKVLQMPEIKSSVQSYLQKFKYEIVFDTLKRFDKQTKLTTDQLFELERMREYFNKEMRVKRNSLSIGNDFTNEITRLKTSEFIEYLKLLKKYKFIKKKDKISFLINVFRGMYYNDYLDKHAFIIEEFLEKDDVDFFTTFIDDLNNCPWFKVGEPRNIRITLYNKYLVVFLRKLTHNGFFSKVHFNKIIKHLLENSTIDETKKAQLKAEYASNNSKELSPDSHKKDDKKDDNLLEKYKERVPVNFEDIKDGAMYFFIPRNQLTAYAGAVVVNKKDEDKFEIIYADKDLHKVPIVIFKETYGNKDRHHNLLYNLLK